MNPFAARINVSLYRFLVAMFSLVIPLSLMAACGRGATGATPIPTSTPQPTSTATPVPPRHLTVCLGQEPTSLYPVNNTSPVAQSVLAAIYDGPIDTNSYGYQPVILEHLPSIGNGDAQLTPTSVSIGDEVVDASGTPVTLAVGIKIRPAGCQNDECSLQYDGISALQMDAMQVTFHLLPGLTWSDGEPLTAEDSVFAYQVAADMATSGSKYLVERTKSYEEVDTTTVQWSGKPGFVDPTYMTNFWSPLPKHAWSQIPVEQLAESDNSARAPLGWGPYVLQEWVAGDHITLTKNLHYFRATDGLPKFDILTFRFVGDPGTAISDLLAGNCDILDPSIQLDGQVDVLRSMASKNQLQAFFTPVPIMEELALDIQPAAYDNNGYASGGKQLDYFIDPHVRQAVAMCIDRQKVVDSVLAGMTNVPNSYLPPADPLYNTGGTTYTLNLAAANQLLEQAGWRDTDNNPATPRQAWGVPGIPSGTPFVVNYVTTNAVQRQQVSTIVATSLAQCGIKVNVQYLDPTVLYAQGPEGVLFGRNFDMAEFAMGTTGIEPPCDWYTSSAIPNNANHWVGENVSGYSNPAFDAACQAAQQTIPDAISHTAAYSQAQTIFAEDLPVIPLYWRVKVAATGMGVCHFSLDPTAASNLWNIEAIDSGAGCQP
jgi:peptide/nickel transport system substrate-binding protein